MKALLLAPGQYTVLANRTYLALRPLPGQRTHHPSYLVRYVGPDQLMASTRELPADWPPVDHESMVQRVNDVNISGRPEQAWVTLHQLAQVLLDPYASQQAQLT